MAKKKIIIIGRGGQNQDADITELQQQVQELTAERNALQLQLGVVQGELEQANANVTTLTSEKEALQQAVDELNTQITDLDTQIETLNARIELLEETIENLGGDVPGEIIPGGPHNPENDAFEEDFLWIENVDDTDGTIALNLEQAPFMYYSYDDDTEFQKMVATNVLSIPAHSKIYLRWKGRIDTNANNGFIYSTSSNCNHNIGGELKNGGLKSYVYQFLFYNDNKLIDASQLKLSATALTVYCYYQMFKGCSSLTTAPELPATTLTSSCYQSMFQGCTSLTTAPELPATTLAGYCYYQMFNGCTSLTTAPELPATIITDRCYSEMFRGCTSLTTAPTILPAATLAGYCYSYMFQGCTSLTTAPELPATTLVQSCYQNMFQGCTSLTTAPELPATTLVYYCYQNMFQGCTSLTTVPELPATTLAGSCYSNMFNGCTSLTTAPELPATTLVQSCYSNMFNGCTSLNYVKTRATSWSTSNANNWLSNVAPTGIVVTLIDTTITENSASGVPSGWTKQIDQNAKNTINIHNVSGLENTISIPNKFSAFKYKTNNDSEYTENPKTTALTVTLQPDEILTIEGIYYPSTSTSSFTGITSTENINISGEVNYSMPYMFVNLFNVSTKLIDASQLKLSATLVQSCYYQMFKGCSSLTTAPELPATTLAGSCYSNMFNGCTSLTTAPELPATTLAEGCYQYMFQSCTSLTTAPELPATIITDRCYYNMFRDCTSLTTAPELPATTLAEGCYQLMFYGCTSLTTVPELPATTLASYCYQNMFQGCSSLTTAPELPATILADSCYYQMFLGCSRLNSLTFLSTEPFIYNDYQAKIDWLRGVPSTGTFRTPIENKEWLDDYPRGISAVPSGWTIEYIE